MVLEIHVMDYVFARLHFLLVGDATLWMYKELLMQQYIYWRWPDMDFYIFMNTGHSMRELNITSCVHYVALENRC